MSPSKKNDLLRDFAPGVFYLRAPPLLGFCLGWCRNFVGYESGQIQSDKLLQNMVSNRTPYPPPLTHCMRTYSILIHTGKGRGGRVEPEKRFEGQQFRK
jgi:hypothetical protein